MKEIYLVDSKKIDKAKWDQTILNATDLIYPLSWYLDSIAESWMAIIYGDYEALLPIPLNRKLIVFQQVYQPYYCQQLGIFSLSISKEIQLEMFKLLESKFVRIRYNSHVELKNMNIDNLKIKVRPNYILKLDAPHSNLADKYHKNHKRNLQKAMKSNINIAEIQDIEVFLDFYLLHLEEKVKGVRKRYKSLLNLLSAAQTKEKLVLKGVYNSDQVLIAANAILKHKDRFINLLPVSSQEGIEKRAMYYLIDAFLAEHAETKSIFDFEGSFIPGIARFFKGFGSLKTSYSHIRKDYFKGFKKD